MCKLRLFKRVVLSVCLFAPRLFAAEFCAVTANVTDSNGKPASIVSFQLEDPAGKVVKSGINFGPQIEICDFGFGPHTLRVGTNECLPVTISDLRLVLGSPLRLRVILNACSHQWPRNACLLYLRVSDDGGNPVSGVRVVRNSRPEEITDGYGRYQSLSRTTDLMLAKEGFQDEKVHVDCRDDEEIDLPVTLKRREGR